MEWKKTKNYTIAFLLVINCIFLAMNIVRHKRTTLGSDDVAALVDVLGKKNIILNCDLPSSYSGMEPLYMRPYEYDNIELQEIFFGKISGVKRTDSGSSTIFTNGSSTLTVKGDTVTFEGSASTQAANEDEAYMLISGYVDELNYSFADYRKRLVKQIDDGFYFELGQNYQRRHIFSNYLKAWVKNNGSIKLVFNYQQPVEYKGSREDIISANEAVYAASKVIEADNKGGAVINNAEIGYFLTEQSGSDEQAAIPQYKIYVNDSESAYFVNAYSGDVTRD